MSAGSFTVIRERPRRGTGQEPPGGPHGQDRVEVIAVLNEGVAPITGQAVAGEEGHIPGLAQVSGA
jgi:hypothetical protein